MSFILFLKKVFFSPIGERMTKEQRNESRGVAIILVLVSLSIVTSIVVDLGYDETVKYRLAIRTSDSVKAEALAAGGLNWATLLFTTQEAMQSILQNAIAGGLEIPIDTIWQMPISSDLLKGFIDGSIARSFGIEVSENKKEENVDRQVDTSDKKSNKKFEKPRYGFGNFDGSFVVEMSDEENKISLQGLRATTDPAKLLLTRKTLLSLFAPQRYDDLFDNNDRQNLKVDRLSLIANLYDWIDGDDIRTDPYDVTTNWGRSGTSSEKEVYRSDKGILPKNAYFDSLGELKLVHGVTDEIEQAFFDSLTIYGEGKINLLSAKEQVIEAVMRYCAGDNANLFENPTFADEAIKHWRDYKQNREGPLTVDGFAGFLEKQGVIVDKKACSEILDIKSKNFTMISKATVGTPPNEVTRTLTLVARVVDNSIELNYFRSK